MADTTALKNRIRAAIKANDNQEITGPVLQQTLLDIVDELDLNPELQEEKNARQNSDEQLQQAIGNEAQTRQSEDTQLNNLITNIKNNIDNGYVYAGIATPLTAPVSGKVFYIAVQAGTYTNFEGIAVTEGITILKYNGTSWAKEQALFTDCGVFDISAYHATEGTLAKYADLAAALNGGNNIPQSLHKGGISIKYVQTSNNKYVQYRLMTQDWSTAIRDWQGIDTVIAKSYLGTNLVYGLEQQTLNYDTVVKNGLNVQFADNIEVGDTIQFETTPYRKVIQINISDLFGFVTTTHASDSLAFVITDINDKILYTQTGASNDYDFPGFVNISVSKEAYYLYIQCFPQDNPVVTLHRDIPFSSPIFKRTCNELEGNPTIIDYYSAVHFMLSDDNTVGNKIKFGQNNYSVIGKLDIDGRTDKIHFDKLMAMSDTTIWIITDDKNNIIDINRNGVISTNVACDILLGKYSKRAKYLYFNFGTGSNNIPTITSLGTDLVNEELPIYVAYQYYKFKDGLSIGDTFDVESTPYLRVFGIDVFDQKGQITIISTVESNTNQYAIVVDKNETILDIITATPTRGEFYATTFVDLDKYPNSYKVYFTAHPNTTYFPYPTATLTNKSIKSKIYESHLSNNAATLLLHFDGTEGTDNYATYRKSILDEYGFKASFIIAPSCFVDNDFSKPWITEELETQFWNLMRDGWDAMLYPSTVSSTYDEEGWKNWMSNALNGLAAKGIFNITCWAAGNLEINNDILNACKANNFKILRGGNGTYPYNVDNWYMPQIPNSANNPIINRAVFVNYRSKLNYVKTYIDYLCASKTAGSLFTHQVLETTSDTNNIDTALFRQILDYIKTKVDSGELIIKTFSEYYASVNPSDGMEWNYNRLLKMQLFNNQQ